MNNVLEYLYNHPRETKRIIGITDKQLIKLIENTQKIEKKIQAIASKEKRLIKTGGGRKKTLKVEEEIILTLCYLRHMPTFAHTRNIFWRK